MPTLFVLSGPDIGKTFRAQDGDVLGRVVDCDVIVRGGSVSRQHARLECENGSWTLLDLGSRNGLRLEGRRVQRVELNDGLCFELGEVEMRFRHAVEPAPEPAGETSPAAPSTPGAIEFEDESLFDAPAAPAPVPGPTKLAPPSPLCSAPPPAARPSVPDRRAQRMAQAGIGARQATAETLDAGGRPALRYSQAAQDSGFLTRDLGQYPLWVRLLAGAAALALFAGLFYFAMRATTALKGSAQSLGGETLEPSSVVD